MTRAALVLLGCVWPVLAGEPAPTTPAQLEFAVSDAKNFAKLGEPGEHDWLTHFPEPGQTFAQYRASRPVRASGERRVLAFLPVGPFTEAQRAVRQATTEFTRIWFELPVRELAPVSLPKKGWQRRVGTRTQYRTPYFLDHLLPDHLPKDAVCVFGVTMGDLYPDDNWHFVFGQASLRRRVGVWSLARYFASFHGGKETEAARRMALRRACKVVVHEAGHAFGMEHCIAFSCNMNGSNSLPETDRQPLHLCPVCLRKLQWNRGFDVLRRYRRLGAFHKKHGLDEEARWVRTRIKRIVRIVAR